MSVGKLMAGCLRWLLVFVVLVALVAVPVGLLLPDAVVSQALALYYSPAVYDLEAPGLVASWRWVLGGAGGLVFALLTSILIGLARRGRRPAAEQTPLDRVQAAAAAGQVGELVTACGEVGATAGEEAVAVLTELLERADDPRARKALAAALYRVGRAVTADVSAHMPRR